MSFYHCHNPSILCKQRRIPLSKKKRVLAEFGLPGEGIVRLKFSSLCPEVVTQAGYRHGVPLRAGAGGSSCSPRESCCYTNVTEALEAVLLPQAPAGVRSGFNTCLLLAAAHRVVCQTPGNPDSD